VDPSSLTYPTRKTWLDLNNGNLFDPFIRAFSANATMYPERYIARSPSSTTKMELPSGYVDLRYRGLGFVWDFGWRRTEEGMEWELGDWVNTNKRYGKEEVGKIPLEDTGKLEGNTGDSDEEGERKWQWVHSMVGRLWQQKAGDLGDW
jgi:hypothetical protein